MIRTSPNACHRAAATFVAAAVLSLTTHRAAAQTSIDLLAGTIGTPASLQASTGLITLSGATTTGTFGVNGYSGSVTVGAGTVNTLSEGFTAPGGSNDFVITETGLAGAAETTVATKTFTTGPQLAANTTYAFTLTRTTASAVGLLNRFDISLSDGGAIFLNTANQTGLLNAVDVLGLFGTNNTATFQFTTPATITGTNLGVTFTGDLPVNAVADQFVFTGATITQVPEPRSVVALLLGAGGLAVLRCRRRLLRAV